MFVSCSLGGHKGFDKVIWDVTEQRRGENPSITSTYHSCDDEEGIILFPLSIFL